MTKHLILILSTAICLTGCQTTPDTDDGPNTIDITTGPIQTCTPLSALTKVDVPPETKTYYATVLIDNPPYEPIERNEKVERVVKEGYTKYVDAEGNEVIDICDEIEATSETGSTT